MKVSLIIPFKNEIEYAQLTMSTVYTYLTEHRIEFEIIVVDDSTDGTWDVLQTFASSYQNISILKGEKPSGYGKALQKGFNVATGDILIPFNGDLSDSLDDVLSYIHLIRNGGYDMVFGSRFMVGSKVENSIAAKESISLLGNKFAQILFNSDCNDLTNSFKAYKMEVLKEISPKADGYQIGIEIALNAILKKYKYTTIPIAWSERKYGRSKMSIIRSIPIYLYTVFKIRLLGKK